MPDQNSLDGVYMQTALLHAGLSKAIRKRVGAVLVTSQGVALTGYNGTAPGASNTCEDTTPEGLVTKKEVLHAELNCILKAAKEGVSCLGATVYVTMSPCLHCSSMLRAVGISRLVYLEHYKDLQGIDYLKEGNIKVERFL